MLPVFKSFLTFINQRSRSKTYKVIECRNLALKDNGNVSKIINVKTV